MFDGERFQRECEEAAELIEARRTGDPVAANRARHWASTGACLIDDPDEGRALRYLLATHASLTDQGFVNTQAVIWRATGVLSVPLWISALSLLWMAWQAG